MKKRTKSNITILSVYILTFFTCFVVFSQETGIPKLINYQGFLNDRDGKALTGNYSITFRLYVELSGTNPWLWQETQDSVTVVSGQFNVLLGSVTPLSASDFDGERYLGIKVAGELEMEPRMQLVSVVYSLQAEHANNAEQSQRAYSLNAPDGDPEDAVSVDNNGNVNILGWQDQKLDENEGYVVIGSLIIRWGNFVSDTDGDQVIKFAKPFKTKCCGVFLNRQGSGVGAPIVALEFGKASFKVNRNNDIDGSPTVNYIAIGY